MYWCSRPSLINLALSLPSCGPMQWSYWLGELLPLGVLHLPLWCVYLIVSIYNKTNNGLSEWVWHTTSIGSTLFLFDVTWAVGLPSTQATDTPLHAVFLVLSIVFGLFTFVLYCLAYRKARVEIMKLINRSNVSKKPLSSTPAIDAGQSPPLSPLTTELDALFQDRAFSMSGIEAGRILQQDASKELSSREIITSFADSMTKEDLDIEESLSPDYQEESSSDVFPCVAKVESINQSPPPITSFSTDPLEEKLDLAPAVMSTVESKLDLGIVMPTAEFDLAVVMPTVESPSAEPQYLPIIISQASQDYSQEDEIPPAEPQYLPLISQASQDLPPANYYSQEDDVFSAGEVCVKEGRRYHSRTLLLSSTLSDEGAWQHGRRPHPPSRQSSVSGPQIVRFALV